MRPVAVLAFLITVAPFFFDTTAHAGEQDDAFAEAKTAFAEGLRRFDAGDFSGAVEAFERSLAIRDSLPVLFNLALAHRKLGDHAKAVEALRRFLALSQETASPSGVQEAKQLLADSEKSICRLNIRASGGTEVLRIDGIATVEGTEVADGLHHVPLNPGRHVVEAQRPGYRPVRKELTLRAGDSTTVELDASRDPLPVELVIDTHGVESKVLIDGEPLADPSNRANLSPGRHRIEVRAPDHKPATRMVDLRPAARERISVQLEPEESGIVEKWWFWTTIGAAVVAAGVGIGIAATRTPEPYTGSLGYAAEALSW